MDERFLSSEEAAGALGVSLPTLYAYVSRGMLRSEPSPGDTRARRYRRDDVDRLKERQEIRKQPARVAETALHWGEPVLESSITLIEDGRLWYRGRDVMQLARERTIDDVAALLWMDDLDADVLAPVKMREVEAGWAQDGLEPIARFASILQMQSARDFGVYDLRQERLLGSATSIVAEFASAVAGSPWNDSTLAESLATALAPETDGASRLLDAALILCADHELNVSSFTVRCIASAGAPLPSALAGGLAALTGIRHGGTTLRAESLLAEVEREGDARRVVAGRMRRGEPFPGFGHRVYPEGDPRARVLLDLLAATLLDDSDIIAGREMVAAVRDLVGEEPTIDVALAVLVRAFDLPIGSALTLMALGRTIGWVAHALEEYERGHLIRPRAKYVGTRAEG